MLTQQTFNSFFYYPRLISKINFLRLLLNNHKAQSKRQCKSRYRVSGSCQWQLSCLPLKHTLLPEAKLSLSAPKTPILHHTLLYNRSFIIQLNCGEPQVWLPTPKVESNCTVIGSIKRIKSHARSTWYSHQLTSTAIKIAGH